MKIGEKIGTEITLLFIFHSVFISFSYFLIKNPSGLHVFFSSYTIASLTRADHEQHQISVPSTFIQTEELWVNFHKSRGKRGG